MKPLKAEKIAEITGGELLCGDPDTIITNIQYDSRSVGEGSLFVPIKGEKVDAHKFIGQCLVNGAATLTQYECRSWQPLCVPASVVSGSWELPEAWERPVQRK